MPECAHMILETIAFCTESIKAWLTPRTSRFPLADDSTVMLRIQLSETDQQNERGDGHDQSDDFIGVERFSEEHHTHSREQQHHRDGIHNTDGRQFQVLHDEDPAKSGGGVENKANVKASRL